MNINRLNKKIVLIALVISLSMAWLSYLFIKKRNTPMGAGDAQAAALKTVLVATEDIPERKTLSEGMFVPTSIPMQMHHENMISDLDPRAEFFARQAITKGEIFYRSKMGVVGEEPELAYMVDWNQGCITLRVTDVTGISGILKPGDFVDVYATYTKDQLNGLPVKDHAESITKRIVPACRVVATDNEVLSPVGPDAKKGAAFNQKRGIVDLKRVTLAAKNRDIEKLVHASTNGKIHLALISDNDKRRNEPPGFGTKDLYEDLFNKNVHTVECIRAGKTELVYVDH